ncbi:hypothetical protein [Streptococcus parauberis]|uniref:hypothetical protein n=1 Tax=Streptococcus parauberis TaxID=1348 RepID=UPI000789ACE2|nr:hypothetical protein [Streptococcus parauberis]KYP17717.1 hypothetical protein TN39_01928 [Streptococcus parauberis]KYP18628.1 hypothetical protein AKL14_00914 [Streptococcus parauberis]KYP20031.1 hypothetical protein AKL13_00831 [Streptococcus parauberis]KYP27362.1 hypothetical protein TM50_00668 [Streptococcus parauberis]KYP27628.1 hypothetical protein TP84_00497 [Streptococcus parauberis]
MVQNNEKARERAKKEMKILDIYIEEAVARIDPNCTKANKDRMLLAACTAYLSAGLSDIDASIEGLYEKIDGI